MSHPGAEISTGRPRSRILSGAKALVAVLLVTIFCAVLGYLLAGLIEPLYKSRAHLLVEATAQEAGEGASSAATVRRRIDGGLLASAEILGAVVEKLRLAENPDFLSSRNLTDPRRWFAPERVSEPAEALAIRRLWEGLRIRYPSGSPLIAVEFRSHNPRLARDVPNAFAAALLAQSAEQDSDSGTRREIAAEATRLRAALKAAEERLAAARSAGSPAESPRRSETGRPLPVIAAELSSARRERTEAEAAARELAAAVGGEGNALSGDTGSAELRALLDQRDALATLVSALAETLLERHPRLREARSRLGGIEARLKATAAAETEQIRSRIAEAREQEAALTRELERAEAAIAAAAARSDRSGEIERLQQAVDEASRLLQLTLLRESELSAAPPTSAPAGIRLLSQARLPPVPYFPKPEIVAGAAGLLGFVLSVTGVVLRRRRAGGAHGVAAAVPSPVPEPTAPPAARPEDVADIAVTMTPSVDVTDQTAPQPAIAHDPPIASEASPPVPAVLPRAEWPGATLAPALVEAASVGEIAEALETSGISRVLVVSADAAAADTGITALARRLAGFGKSVAVVDLSRSGSVSRSMGAPAPARGVSDVLLGRAAIGDIIIRDRFTGSDLLPRGTVEAPAAENAAALGLILAALAETYDCSLLSCGPEDAAPLKALAGSEAAVLVPTQVGSGGAAGEAVTKAEAAGLGEIMVMQIAGRSGTPPAPRAA